MTKPELFEKLTGEREPKFITERENVMVDKCLAIINGLENSLDEIRNAITPFNSME